MCNELNGSSTSSSGDVSKANIYVIIRGGHRLIFLI